MQINTFDKIYIFPKNYAEHKYFTLHKMDTTRYPLRREIWHCFCQTPYKCCSVICFEGEAVNFVNWFMEYTLKNVKKNV